MKTLPIPVVLFAYSRPDHLQRVLACLRENKVPLIYAYADGPKSPEVAPRVAAVRTIMHKVDWCEIHIIERQTNLGLGKSILSGVGEVFQKHVAIIVIEDDLVFVPGTYQYLCAALEHYQDDPRVMSVTGWSHPRLTPGNVFDQPYFSGRAVSWSWGSWARAWQGMDENATSLLRKCQRKGIDIYKYGADLPEIAIWEQKINVWAVRFAFLHILHGGLCLRPPHSLVNHAGFDGFGTNATDPSDLMMEVLEPCPPIPQKWPEAVENPECPALYRKEYGGRLSIQQRIISPTVRLLRYTLGNWAVTSAFQFIKACKLVLNKIGFKRQ
jgi:hypothetical protein